MADIAGWVGTPAATKQWLETALASITGATVAAWVREFWENWLLWGMGGIDIFVGLLLFLLPELTLGWGFGFNVFTLDAPSKGRLYGETTYVGAASMLLGAV